MLVEFFGSLAQGTKWDRPGRMTFCEESSPGALAAAEALHEIQGTDERHHLAIGLVNLEESLHLDNCIARPGP